MRGREFSMVLCSWASALLVACGLFAHNFAGGSEGGSFDFAKMALQMAKGQLLPQNAFAGSAPPAPATRTEFSTASPAEGSPATTFGDSKMELSTASPAEGSSATAIGEPKLEPEPPPQPPAREEGGAEVQAPVNGSSPRIAELIRIASESRTRYPWSTAVGQFVKVTPQQNGSVEEHIWAVNPAKRPPCGQPCVAHCLVGPWRKSDAQDRWGARHREVIKKFSRDALTFAVITISELGGKEYFVKKPSKAVGLDQVGFAVEELRPDRALIKREACTTSLCYRKSSHMRCDEWPNKTLNAFYRKAHRYDLYAMCDIQVGRVGECMELVREYEHDTSTGVDWVARQRVDQKFMPVHWHIRHLDEGLIYLAPRCEHERPSPCYGGWDWWYIMPRRAADSISAYRSGITCGHVGASEVMFQDPYYGRPTACDALLSCEGWLISWLVREGLKFAPLGCCLRPDDNKRMKHCRLGPKAHG